MEIKLLPCPFCGSEAECDKDLEADQWFVECKGCGVRMGDTGNVRGFSYQENACEAWNKRNNF